MKMYIEGYRSNNIKLTAAISNAAWFYAEELLGRRMTKYILVDIKLTKNLKEKEGAYGFCHITGSVNKPREFMIELDVSMKHSWDQILTWLAHEMAHLKQFVRNELYDGVDGSVQWKSKRYVRSPQYDDMPWEKEAYRLEEKLYEKFVEVVL